ncbi:MAG: dTMP kinase, partial [Nanoarchaeota archaeon]
MKIICLEGCSGTGKTTQYHLLNKHYDQSYLNHLAVVEKEYEPFKSAVRRWHETKGPNVSFTDKDVRDFARARAETFANNFSKLENEIDFILMDRYFYTSAVYQVDSGLKPKEILRINLDFGAPVPDLTFLFDCDSYLCFQRANERNKLTGCKHLFSTSPERISEIRERYLDLMDKKRSVKIIDSYKSILNMKDDLI